MKENIIALSVEMNPLEAAYAALLTQGRDGAGEMLRILVNEAGQIERAHHLNAHRYERSDGRTGHANGFKPKTVMTCLGEITFDVPPARDSSYCPSTPAGGPCPCTPIDSDSITAVCDLQN